IIPGVPRFHRHSLHISPALRLTRISCDGVDETRPDDEQVDSARLVIVLRGSFVMQSRRSRTVADPGSAIVFRPTESYRVCHPRGDGDVCLSVSGRFAQHMAREHGEQIELGARGYAQVQRLLAIITQGGADPLQIEETLCSALMPPTRV